MELFNKEVETDRLDGDASAILMLRGVMTNFYEFAAQRRDDFDAFFLRGKHSEAGAASVHQRVEEAFLDRTGATASPEDPAFLVTAAGVGLRVVDLIVGDRDNPVGVTYLGELLPGDSQPLTDQPATQPVALPISRAQSQPSVSDALPRSSLL